MIDTFMRTFLSAVSGLAMETIPFLLIGTAASSAIHAFVPERAIRRLLPRNRAMAVMAAAAAGLVLPVCECAIVPLSRRLRDKGVPESAALAFMLAAPIVNPMTTISTAMAFNGLGRALWPLRLGAGYAIAVSVALIVEAILPSRARPSDAVYARAKAGAMPKAPFAAPASARKNPARARIRAREAIPEFLRHAGAEFLDTSRFLVAGIIIAGLFRAAIPVSALSGLLRDPIVAIPAGMAAAFVLSLCSSADAFVARTLFVPQSYGATIAFLLFGPMLDIKTAALLSRFMPKSDLRRLAALLVLACFAAVICLAPIWSAWK